MKDKATGSVGFRPRGRLAELIELMDKLDMNKSGIFNEILEANASVIEKRIERRRQEMRELLEATAH